MVCLVAKAPRGAGFGDIVREGVGFMCFGSVSNC